MIELGPCELTGAYGPMASGKTYLIDQWLKNQNRYVRFDVTGESCDNPTVEHIYASPRALYERLTANPFYFRVAYHPGPDISEDFEFAVRIVWRLKVFKLLVCDEFHEVCGVSDTPGYVRTMMRYARHNNLAFIGASQRIADVSKLFTAGCRTTVLFWTQEARDLDAISDRWGEETADAVANLRPLIYNDVTKKTKQIPQCVVCKKSSRPEVYDFATDKFTRIGRRGDDSGENEPSGHSSAATEIQSEDRRGTDDARRSGSTQGRNRSDDAPIGAPSAQASRAGI